MGQVLHRSATATAAIRRAKHSRESLRTLSRRHSINPKTVAKWRKHCSPADHRTGPSPAHRLVPDGSCMSREALRFESSFCPDEGLGVRSL